MARIATEQQFQEWERLIEGGTGRFEAAQQAGTTLSALKRGDRTRFEWGVELSLERQSAKAEALISKETSKSEPSPQLVALEVRAHHPDYAEKTQLEVSGQIGVNHPDLIAAFEGFVAQLAELAGRRDKSLPPASPAGDAPALPALPVAVQRKA